MRLIIGMLAALALAGCASTDDYQYGDITSGVLGMQAEYCATADPRARAFRVAALRAAGVPIPPSGACSDILALVPEAELDIDVEQAREDQRRFQEQGDADTDTQPAPDVQGAE